MSGEVNKIDKGLLNDISLHTLRIKKELEQLREKVSLRTSVGDNKKNVPVEDLIDKIVALTSKSSELLCSVIIRVEPPNESKFPVTIEPLTTLKEIQEFTKDRTTFLIHLKSDNIEHVAKSVASFENVFLKRMMTNLFYQDCYFSYLEQRLRV